MLSSKQLIKSGLLIAVLLAVPALAGCTFAPVYSGKLAERPNIPLAYAKPDNRMEQIINQQLALRLGASDVLTAPLAKVVANSSVRARSISQTVNPYRVYEVTVTATLNIEARDGSESEPLTFTRAATAQFNSNSQVLADTEAQIEARERAAKAVAESLRLAVLASLSRR
ncbi:hypothetical protein PSQ90_08210 [Devosia rhodophyticola]|uniref:LPS-assembly lipoprotein n=1 Tax=Devosia rhodophyticola TaxID=3026423 RepID=A0ABY7Z150_9HYPH|nr:hypothetical protein [Devosia rhodophyticola]WDR07388.1 hypothetical protein PSQ90_08210 [Devosia rhodophyticola]